MFVKIKDTYINPAHVSLVSLRNDNRTLVVDLAYSKAEDPVFVTFQFDTEKETLEALHSIVGDV
jgi:hypothetical protein